MKLNVKLFADGADKNGIIEMSKNPIISGFTTNPTLMKAAGVSDYVAFAKDMLSTIQDRPISFEVFSDDFGDMERQAIEISSWGSNVNVKIPITNTQGESSAMLIKKLTDRGIQQNVTAIMTAKQVESILPQLVDGPGGFVSVFAGRIADAGIDPLPIMKEVVYMLKDLPQIELIWASPRELYNVVQANDIGCDIITATSGILKKLNTLGKDLDVFSLETVKMFYDDAKNAGYQL